jgi:beta-lactamase regulating signal transducer with metallopeptidase domain
VSSRRFAPLCLCVVLALALTAPATTFAAVGGSGAFSELTEGQTETTPTTETTTTAATTETTSNTGSVLWIAGGAALLLLGGIAFLIMRDARSVAPAGDGLLGKGGSGHDTAAMMRKRRAKAKAARRQRKQNIKRGK